MQLESRSRSAADSGVWVAAADMKAWMCGLPHTAADLDVEEYRLKMRECVSDLKFIDADPEDPPELPKFTDFVKNLINAEGRWPVKEFAKDYIAELGEWRCMPSLTLTSHATRNNQRQSAYYLKGM